MLDGLFLLDNNVSFPPHHTGDVCELRQYIRTNKEILSTLLVDRLVNGRIFLAVGGGPGRHRLQGILTHLHPQGVVKFLKSLLRLHQVKATKHDGTVILHLLFQLHGVVLEVGQLCLGVVAGDPNVGGAEFQPEFGQLLFLDVLLELANVRDSVAPCRQG